jgi:hypothetical protein
VSRTISSRHSLDTVTSSKPMSKCITCRIPTEKLHKLTKDAEAKEVSLNTLFNQIIKEHLDLHALAPRAKLYYMPKLFLMRLINEFSEKELSELARDMAKSDLVDISLFLSGEFSIASISEIAETWLRISKMPYRYETNGDSSKIIIQHEMGLKYSYLIREICRYLLEVAFEAKASYNVTDDTLVIEADIFKR